MIVESFFSAWSLSVSVLCADGTFIEGRLARRWRGRGRRRMRVRVPRFGLRDVTWRGERPMTGRRHIGARTPDGSDQLPWPRRAVACCSFLKPDTVPLHVAATAVAAAAQPRLCIVSSITCRGVATFSAFGGTSNDMGRL